MIHIHTRYPKKTKGTKLKMGVVSLLRDTGCCSSGICREEQTTTRLADHHTHCSTQLYPPVWGKKEFTP